VQQAPKKEGRNMMMLISPKKWLGVGYQPVADKFMSMGV
jgi:hypothetical protein